MKKRILLDVDEVICFSGFLEVSNEFMGTDFDIDYFTDYYIDEVLVPKERFDEFNRFLLGKNLYENAKLLPNGVRVIEKLNKYYDIYPCTSCINPFDLNGSGKLFKDKYDFLLKTIPFIRPQNFIFTDTKNLFKADIQIDDRIQKLESSDVKIKILFPSYHNKSISDEELKEKNIIRAGYDWREGWNNIEKILLKPQ